MEEDKDKDFSVIELDGIASSQEDELNADLHGDVVELDEDPALTPAEAKEQASIPDSTRGAAIKKYFLDAGIEESKIDRYLANIRGIKKFIFQGMFLEKEARYRLQKGKDEKEQAYFEDRGGARSLLDLDASIRHARFYHDADLDLLAISLLACNLPSHPKSEKIASAEKVLDHMLFYLSFGIDEFPIGLVNNLGKYRINLPKSLQSHNFFMTLDWNQKVRPSKVIKYKEFLRRFDIDPVNHSSVMKLTDLQLSTVCSIYIYGVKLNKTSSRDAGEINWSDSGSKDVLRILEKKCEMICSIIKMIGKCERGAALATAMLCPLLEASNSKSGKKIDREILAETSRWLLINAPLSHYSNQTLTLLDESIPTGQNGGHARDIIDHLKKNSTTTTTTTTTSTTKSTIAQPVHSTTTTSTSTRTPTTTSGTTPPVHTPSTPTSPKKKDDAKGKGPKKAP